MAIKATINPFLPGTGEYVACSAMQPQTTAVTYEVVEEEEPEEEPEDPDDYEIYDLQKVKIEAMSFCCGIRVLGEARDLATEDQIVEDIRTFMEVYSDDGDGKPGLLLYSIDFDNQKREVAALKRLRFEVLSEFTNPKTGHKVRLYGKLVNQ